MLRDQSTRREGTRLLQIVVSDCELLKAPENYVWSLEAFIGVNAHALYVDWKTSGADGVWHDPKSRGFGGIVCKVSHEWVYIA